MKQKKSVKADLENKKGMFLQVGMIVALSVILIAFEWTTGPAGKSDLKLVNEITYEDDMVLIEREDPQVEQPKKELPDVIEVIELVDDDVPLPAVDLGNEVDKYTMYDYINLIDNGEEDMDEDIPWIKVEEKPTFNGGDPMVEFWKFIGKNVVYPEIAVSNDISGKVFVQFTVDKTGKVVNAKIIRSVDPALDKEALRVVNSSPSWTPGKQRGKPVRVIYTFPINFILQ